MIDINPKYLKKEHSNPFNYTGSKHRYLSDIFEVLPNAENLKVLDPFVGGGDLISKLPKSWRIVAGDISPQLIDMHKQMQNGVINTKSTLRFNESQKLNATDEVAYNRLRTRYNKRRLIYLDQSVKDLYSLICHSNSNRMRFNNDGDFNMPFGKRTFNGNMQAKLDNYGKWLNGAAVTFLVQSFEVWNFNNYDLLLIDSPYPGAVACYNEGGGWTTEQEAHLYTKIDLAAKRHGTKFIFFGQTWANGAHNPTLEMWALKYNVKVLKDTTHHCSSNRKNGKTVEIMVWN